MKAIKSIVIMSVWLGLACLAVFGSVQGAANLLAFAAGVFGPLMGPLMLSKGWIADAKPEAGKRVTPAWVSRPLRLATVGVMVWGGLFWTAAGFGFAYACGSAHRQAVAKRDAVKEGAK
jgi:hypothetical protein